MSNLIKAYNIRYDETFRPLDMNEKSEELKDKFIEMDKARKPKVIGGEFTPLEFPEAGEIEGAEPEEGEAFEANFTPEELLEKTEELERLNEQIEENKEEIARQEAHIEELQQQADLVFENTKKEAERTIAQANLNANKARIEIFDKAKTEGYQEGAAKAQEELDAAKAELEATETQLREYYEKQVEQMEPAFVSMLIKYVEKITGILIEERQDIILYVIDKFLKKQEKAENIIIRVSPGEYELVREHMPDFEAVVPGNAGFEIIEDKLLGPTQCMIDCDSRLFDVSLENDLKGLIADLKLLSM